MNPVSVNGESPRRTALARAAPWLLSVTAALLVDRLVTVEWTFPYCSDMSDGPASAVFGAPLPYERWSGVSSLEFDFMPHVWLLDVVLLTFLAYRPARWVWLRTRARRMRRVLVALACFGTLLPMAFVLQLVRHGLLAPVRSIAQPPYEDFADYRPVALVVGRHYDCTPSPWWFPDVAPGARLRARVVEVRPSLESISYLRVVVEFENDRNRDQVVKRYAVTWPGGSKSFAPSSFTIGPSGRVRRTLRVFHNDGDLKALTAASARVDVQGED